MNAPIAVVVDTFPRWSERFIARELQELRRRGVELAIFALARGKLPPGDDPEWTGLLDRVRVLPSMPSPRTVAAALKAVPALRTKAARERLALVQKALGPRGVLRCARAHVLTAFLKECGARHVHAHFASLPSTIAWISAQESHLPWSLSVHARDLFVEAQLLAEKARDARAIFACHEGAFARLKLLGGLGKRAVLMPHGLPLERFPPRAARPLERREPATLLAAGRFVGKKGFHDLLAALSLPALAKRKLRLSIFGDGPERAKLLKEIEHRGLAAKVLLHPPQSGTRFVQELAGADCFVAPYRPQADGDRDGVPNIVLEAFALGVPVVGTDVGGLPEVLNAQTGFPASAGAPESLATAIAACLDAPAEAARRSAAARALIEARYDIRKNIEPLYHTLTAQK